uniref:Transcription factor MYC/MYB N-terminal domain-containing protein n=1 Tax=Oryza rufipogon TaxID=4529 RepID=A0A0E0R7Y5_ORYRU
MVGSGAAGGGGGGGGGGDHARSKEAAGMMALHEALRNVCLNSDWTYSVFWTIRPRPRCRGGNGCKVGDDNGSLMLMWEDGFCRPRVAECLEDIDGEDPVRKAFSKMSIQLYNYGEGLMGKVASDKCHKWVFKEPSECEPNIANYWQSSFDATIAVIQAGHGLLQLGSCKIIPEDLHFVLRMRHMFESLGYQSGFFLSQLFSSSRGTSPSPSSFPLKQQQPPPPPAARPPPQLFNWPGHAPPQLPPGASPLFPPGPAAFHPSSRPMPPFPGGGKDESHLKTAAAAQDAGHGGAENVEEYLSLESHSNKARRMESAQSTKFKRSFTLPARMSSSTTSTSPSVSASTAPAPPQQQQGMEYRGPHEGGVYSDLMETFLE